MTTAFSRASARIISVTERESLTGSVLGMQATAVKPPRAAARAPLAPTDAEHIYSPGPRGYTDFAPMGG